jgi:hypothetical protein
MFDNFGFQAIANFISEEGKREIPGEILWSLNLGPSHAHKSGGRLLVLKTMSPILPVSVSQRISNLLGLQR